MHISSIGASVRRWHESNFGRGCLGRLGPKSFGVAQKKNDRDEILVWVKHMILWTFIMIPWSFIDLSCDSSLFSVVSAHTVFEPSTQFIFHYFIKKCIKCQISSFKTSVFFGAKQQRICIISVWKAAYTYLLVCNFTFLFELETIRSI